MVLKLRHMSLAEDLCLLTFTPPCSSSFLWLLVLRIRPGLQQLDGHREPLAGCQPLHFILFRFSSTTHFNLLFLAHNPSSLLLLYSSPLSSVSRPLVSPRSLLPQTQIALRSFPNIILSRTKLLFHKTIRALLFFMGSDRLRRLLSPWEETPKCPDTQRKWDFYHLLWEILGRPPLSFSTVHTLYTQQQQHQNVKVIIIIETRAGQMQDRKGTDVGQKRDKSRT